MEHSYFYEPAGIFLTTSGFSMGDISASRSTEVSLRDSELDIFRKLDSYSLLENITLDSKMMLTQIHKEQEMSTTIHQNYFYILSPGAATQCRNQHGSGKIS